jgi:hypothetical protein
MPALPDEDRHGGPATTDIQDLERICRCTLKLFSYLILAGFCSQHRHSSCNSFIIIDRIYVEPHGFKGMSGATRPDSCICTYSITSVLII